jgi:hypothetical protein
LAADYAGGELRRADGLARDAQAAMRIVHLSGNRICCIALIAV